MEYTIQSGRHIKRNNIQRTSNSQSYSCCTRLQKGRPLHKKCVSILWLLLNRRKNQIVLLYCIMNQLVIQVIDEHWLMDRLKWNWVDPRRLRSGDPNVTLTKLASPRMETLCVRYALWQEPLFLGEGRRNSSSLTAQSRVTGWKVHFDPWRGGFRSTATPHPLNSLVLAVWPFKWPLDTVHVSHALAATNRGHHQRLCKCSSVLGLYSLIIVT